MMLLYAVGGTAVVTVGLLLAGLSMDTSLAFAGLAFGAITLVVAELRQRELPRKKVVYIGMEDSLFGTNIVDGLRAELSGSFPHTLTILLPSREKRDLVRWQRECLGLTDVRSADALIILPCRDDGAIWEGLVALAQRGVAIIVIDVEPPQDFFADRHVPVPIFVASDFPAGGRAAGRVIAERLAHRPSARAFVCMGPDWSKPGSTRTSWLLYELARQGCLTRTTVFELTSWDPEKVVPTVVERLRQLRSEQLIVFAGTDWLLSELSQKVLATDGIRDAVELIGYDGILRNDGRLLASATALAIATIDTRPAAQGRTAGQVVRELYENRTSATRFLVEPVAVTAPTWR
ncbi:hypothetical protein BKM31_18540 [[Actinomadura] parvosata subsp. kistnae]|uniref:Periplasmic binding protein domain-containing protein n=1 Tax=[Actinomadura] parvosata subsp. kistnae TaxID=1909395 RepID=A0A1U9ZZ07_9ACTN|nr:hypothetical protein [Nonomuraea sp. ATCC 55076]AQZ63193.1 hypothetical protein BKM31_18540 [Nonomuraea sp. ATCC 55076]